MKNLNAEQIKKALECCNSEGHICGKCPYESVRIGISCRDKLIRDALALITSQEQRIKELEQCWEHEHASAMEIFGQWSEKCEWLTEENERLRAENVDCKLGFSLLEDAFQRLEKINNQIEADTVRKMQERLKAQKFTHKNFGELVYVEDIDHIAKEMLEGEK